MNPLDPADTPNTATALAASNPLDNVRIVLVNTSHPGNIGATARAMKNMGLRHLYLVAPQRYPSDEATWRAANAADVLDGAIVVDSFETAVAGCSLVIGTSARERTIPWPLLDPRRACAQAYREAARQPIALVFGREDRGLTNEELQKCQLHIHIPTNPEYSSLNIAMAVQVLAYELRMAHVEPELTADAMEGWDFAYANNDDIERFFTHLDEALTEMGFLKPDAPKQTSARLRRLFQRTRLDAMEINIFRGILSSAQYWVRRAKGGQGDGEQ
ncbi:MAG TPA: tRNA (cytosine(32)/uridine(32)-2'-O)-methyltransferase TrmJ [Spongiibacteraceae bacterium]|nr:tRNA (cytosine(32)/uridine(32)-2'-O)-methyltransferase TrmJ [Spongiibacteraceae bacterium]